MAAGHKENKPLTYFLNEAHELSTEVRTGGGPIPQYVNVSWGERGRKIGGSIDKAVKRIQGSHDPLRDERYFVVARPVEKLEKKSKSRRASAEGTLTDIPSFGGVHGRVFDRLGLDLLQVTDEGHAVVHGSRDRVEQLAGRSKTLESSGAREQARWVTIDAFDVIPPELRIDEEWLKRLKSTELSDVVFELQPILGRVDADRVLRALADTLRQGSGRSEERLTGSGMDFSGRYWFRGKATQGSIRAIAKDFFSVQAIHSPLYSDAAGSARRPSVVASKPSAAQLHVDPKALPCVAVVDLGVPADHISLAAYRRGQFVPQDASVSTRLDHASFVASRVIFGEFTSSDQLIESVGRCSFYDAVVGDGYTEHVDDKIVMDALRGVRGAAPDVRVFNLSFGDPKPLAAFLEVERREKRLLLQDLDNFISRNDVIVVVCAGNSQKGVVPDPAYPKNYEDPRWALGPLACGFNTLICGAFVGSVSAEGLVKHVGWPSPFSRVGPGLCGAPIPSFGAEGGNCDSTHNSPVGHGVWGFSGAGLAEDRAGTSYAAPLLAREAALAFATLQQYCAVGTQPFAVTVRAFLAATAMRTTDNAIVKELVDRTLGLGKGSADRLSAPRAGSAVILWQGTIESSKDTVRVQLPIPKDWLAAAEEPVLRLFVAYDPPVNEAAKEQWVCRKVALSLHTGPEEDGIRGPNRAHATYPLFWREYKLAPYAPGGVKPAADDLWVLEAHYDEVFDYPPGISFDPRQRVAFAAELIDRGANPVDPQPSMQALPIAASMNRLSIISAAVRTPVLVRTRR